MNHGSLFVGLLALASTGLAQQAPPVAIPTRISLSHSNLSLDLPRAKPAGAPAAPPTPAVTPSAAPLPSAPAANSSPPPAPAPAANPPAPARLRVGDVFVSRAEVVVRSGPGNRFRGLGSLDAGQPISLQDWIGPWYAFEFAGRLGWVHAGNLSAGPYTRALALGDPGAPQSMGSILAPAASPAPGQAAAATGPGAPATNPNGTTTQATLAAASQAASNASQSSPASTGPGTGQPAPSNPNRPVSSAGFVQLAASGPGFYSYTSAGNRWGLPNMVYGIERVGRRWEQLGPRPRIGSGDLSYRGGGRMRGHVSHRKGEDVDVRPVRNDGDERPVTIDQRAYSHALTKELIELFYVEHGSNYDLNLFNDTQVPHTRTYPNHSNHFHLRIHR